MSKSIVQSTAQARVSIYCFCCEMSRTDLSSNAESERPCPTRIYVLYDALQAIAIYATDDNNNSSKKPISVVVTSPSAHK